MAMRIDGMDALQRKLERLGHIAQDMSGTMSEITSEVQSDARDRCPVRTGALKASIERDTNTDAVQDIVTGIVYTDKDYAPSVEFGRFDTPARPFLYPALKDNEDKITDRIADAARKSVIGVARGG